MINNAKNKVLAPEERETKAEAKPAVLTEYHFAGSGEWQPQTVEAKSLAEAEAEWKATRKPITK